MSKTSKLIIDTTRVLELRPWLLRKIQEDKDLPLSIKPSSKNKEAMSVSGEMDYKLVE